MFRTHKGCGPTELRSCVEVEMDVLGRQLDVRIVPTVSVDVNCNTKQTVLRRCVMKVIEVAASMRSLWT